MELDLGFAVGNVLTHDRIVLLELQLGAGGLGVLAGGVEVTGASGGDELDEGTHVCVLSLRLEQSGVSADLVNDAQTTRGHAHTHKLLL